MVRIRTFRREKKVPPEQLLLSTDTTRAAERYTAQPIQRLHHRPQYCAKNRAIGPRVEQWHYLDFTAKFTASARLRISSCPSASRSLPSRTSAMLFQNAGLKGVLVSIVVNATLRPKTTADSLLERLEFHKLLLLPPSPLFSFFLFSGGDPTLSPFCRSGRSGGRVGILHPWFCTREATKRPGLSPTRVCSAQRSLQL